MSSVLSAKSVLKIVLCWLRRCDVGTNAIADTRTGSLLGFIRQVCITRGRLYLRGTEKLADHGAIEEPDFGARRVQYQAAVVRKSVRSVWA